MTKRRKKQLQRERASLPLATNWEDYLAIHDLSTNTYARIAAGALEDPNECDINWFKDIVEALKLCREKF